MKIDELNTRHIIAEEGKVFRRISDSQLFGNEIFLGYTHYLRGEKLPEPLLEQPEHFEEIDDPAEEEIILLDEATPLEGTVETLLEETQILTEEPVSVEVSRRVTLADFHRLEKQVELLMQMMGGVK